MVGRQVVGRQVVGRQLGRRLLSGFWRGFIAANLAAMVLFLLPASAPAQVQSLVAPQSVTAPAAGPVTGWPGSPGATILAPAPVAPAPVAPMPAAPLGTSPVAQAAPAIPAGQVLLDKVTISADAPSTAILVFLALSAMAQSFAF